jgi:hypothetical protein
MMLASELRMSRANFLAGVGLFFLVGCSAGAQKPALQTAWQDQSVRHASFEATLRVLDEHPEYVHEFLGQALEHEVALNAFLDDTAERLAEDSLSRHTAEHLAAHPKGLKQVLIATLDRVSNLPAAEDAAAQAMASRPQMAAIVITQREDALAPTLHQLVLEVSKNARARRWFLHAMAENSEQLAALVAGDPEVLKAFVKAIGHLGLKKGQAELEAFIKALP